MSPSEHPSRAESSLPIALPALKRIPRNTARPGDRSRRGPLKGPQSGQGGARKWAWLPQVGRAFDLTSPSRSRSPEIRFRRVGTVGGRPASRGGVPEGAWGTRCGGWACFSTTVWREGLLAVRSSHHVRSWGTSRECSASATRPSRLVGV